MGATAKEVEIELGVPLVNIQAGTKKTYFGKVKVPTEIADDLKRREAEYHQYERSLIRDNGQEIDAGKIAGNQGN